MKTALITKKLPQLVDCALAIAISAVPGFAEADAETKTLYKSLAKQLLTNEIKAKRLLVQHKMRLLIKAYPTRTATAA
ncbi:MAG: hypothetical protein ACO1N4_13670 [Pedobacter sp.]|jgi:hypothetical protein